MTAISMADGYARVSGRPQAVMVHVYVGTQALAHGIHNTSIGRVPMLLFAGLAPITESGELPGSRTEYQHWLQDPHDQKAIVRQYCRYAGEIRSGLNIKRTIGRALQFAMSAPKGPVYLAAAREVLAEEIKPYSLDQEQCGPIGPGALPADALHDITKPLAEAARPLILTGYSGRDRRVPDLLVAQADLIPGILVQDTGGSDVCFPRSHIASEGYRLPGLSFDTLIEDADVVLLIDCDILWIPSRNPPPREARIFCIDSDPLNQQMSISFFPDHGRWKADAFIALKQLTGYIHNSVSLTTALQDGKYSVRREARKEAHARRLVMIAAQACLGGGHKKLDPHNISSLLKSCLPDSTTYVLEAITAAQESHDQLLPIRPGSWLNCGATGIGWSNGAALGVKMALSDLEESGKPNMVCHIVDDGSFLYEFPILTIVLNNGSWKAPRHSARLVYPNGMATSASDEEINTSFNPTPNYAALAEAAADSSSFHADNAEEPKGWMMGKQARTVRELKEALLDATNRVAAHEKGMLIEAAY